MKRADLNKRAHKDKFGTGKHGFQSGNPSTGLLPTIPGADWFDHVQEEICNLLEAFGIAPNQTRYDQLKTLFTSKLQSASLSQQGLVQLSNAINSAAENMAATPKAVMDALAAAMAGNLTMHGHLGGKNLNDLIGPLHYGIHYQGANASATSGLNYPAQKAGTLMVLPSAYSGVQLYVPFDVSLIYIRHHTGINGVMSPWRSIGEVENSLTSISATTALSAAQGKVLNDAKADKATTINAGNGLTGGGTLAVNRTLALGTPGTITASSANAVQTESHTHAIDNSILMPTGAIAYLTGATVPPGWLKANGAAVSRTTYASLFAAIGTRYGAGNGSTTFNLPDLRGEFVRGWDDSRGVDSGRALGSAQSDAIRNITGVFGTAVDSSIENTQSNGCFYTNNTTIVTNQTEANQMGQGHRSLFFDASRVVPTAGENRPRNIALMAVIKI